MTIASTAELTADNTETFCDQLAETVDSLIAVLDEESRLVRAAQLHDAGVLHAKKTALAAQYGDALNTLKHNAAAIRAHAENKIDHLKSRQNALEEALQTNMTVLATARTVAETLIRGVQEDAIKETNAPAMYGADARQMRHQPAKSAISVNAAI